MFLFKRASFTGSRQKRTRKQRPVSQPTPDIEAPAKMIQKFARDPQHSMWPEPQQQYQQYNEGANWDEDAKWDQEDENAEFLDDETLFLKFYDDKVKDIQKKAGDNDHAPISGNLYMYRAIAGFGDASGLFQDPEEIQVKIGLWFVVVVQVIGPACILFWAIWQINIEGIGFTQWKYEYGSMDNGVSNLAQHILGVFFLILFMLNGSHALQSDKEETGKLVLMCKVFQKAAARTAIDEEHTPWPAPEEMWLWFGAIINAWCLILSSICMCLLFVIAEDGPKDVLFDAFGLTFLYNLDDVGGDLGFLDSKWDEDQMGDIYGVLVDQEQLMEQLRQERDEEISPDNIYECANYIIMVLLFVLPFAFIFVNMEPREDF